MKIRPTYDRIVVRAPKPEEITPGGIVIPKTANQEEKTFLQGIVIAIGPGRVDERGNMIAMQATIGERVVFSRYSGTLVILNENTPEQEQCFVLKDGDVLGVLEEDPPMTVEALLGEDPKAGQ